MTLSYRLIDTLGVTAPPRSALKTRLRRPASAHIRDMLVGLVLTAFATAVVHADEALQGWIPEVLTIPEDAEVLMDRAIGSTVRMYSIATFADTDALLADWEESLGTNGYPITQGTSDLLDRSIEFTGPGIANAKIVVTPATEDGRSVIEFDATLN